MSGLQTEREMELNVAPAVRNPLRLAALRRTLLLDSPSEEAFDRLTRLAAKILRAPVALVSLVDEDRQFFKSCIGLPEPWSSRRETPLSHSFCQHTLETARPLLIEDARQHPLVRDNLAIRDLSVIAYAGIPLIAQDGQTLGSFCVIDNQPRVWTDEEVEILQDLAAAVLTEIELRLATQEAEQRADEAEQEREQRTQLLGDLEIERARLQAVLEQLPSGVVIAEAPSGRVLLGNAQMDAIMRQPFFEAQSIDEYGHYPGVHPDGRPYAPEDWPLARSVLRGETVHDEVLLLLQDGGRSMVELRSAPIRNAEGQVVAGVAVCTDVTERKQAEEQRRATQSQLQAILDNARTVIYAKDLSGRFLFVNRHFTELFKVSPEQVVGRTDRDLFPPEVAAAFQAHDQEVLARNIPIEYEEVALHDDGPHSYVSTKFPLYDDTGAAYAVCGVSTDITPQKREAQTLGFLSQASSVLASSLDYQATLEQVCRLLVPQIADYCLIHTLETDGQLRQVMQCHVDQEQEPLLESLGKLYGSQQADQHSLTAHVIATGSTVLLHDLSVEQVDTLSADPDAQAIYRTLQPVSQLVVPLVARGATRGLLTLARASSGRRYSETDLAITQEIAHRVAMAVDNARLYHEAREAVREREALLSVASHELKNPLASLMGFANLLERRVVPGNAVTEREQRHVRTIRDQAGRINKMLDVLLDVARIEGGQLVIHPVPVDLHLLVAQAIAEFAPALAQHTIVYHEPDIPAIVMGDEIRLEQVLRNLIGNAVKYSPAGGEITIELAVQDRQVRLVVQDQGIGIATAALPRLFQRFSRVQSAQMESIKGLGLGLYVVKEIVTLHNGTIDVASSEGQGSAFTVRLPAHTIDEY